MRFTLNAFILSTVALLSLITPLVHADGDAVTVTNPVAGETLNAFESVDVTWTVNDNTVGNVNCIIALNQDEVNLDVPDSPGILQSGVPILQGHSNGGVEIPDVVSGSNYKIQILSADQSVLFGESGDFTIL